MSDDLKFWFILALVSFVLGTIVIIITIKLMIRSFNKIEKTDK